MRVQLGALEMREAIEEYIRSRVPAAIDIEVDGGTMFAHVANVRIGTLDRRSECDHRLSPYVVQHKN